MSAGGRRLAAIEGTDARSSAIGRPHAVMSSPANEGCNSYAPVAEAASRKSLPALAGRAAAPFLNPHPLRTISQTGASLLNPKRSTDRLIEAPDDVAVKKVLVAVGPPDLSVALQDVKDGVVFEYLSPL